MKIQKKDPEPDTVEARLSALEQVVARQNTIIGQNAERLEWLKQATSLMAAAEKNALTSLQEALQKLAVIERGMGALRIRKGLEEASRIFRKDKTVIFIARECGGNNRIEYFGDNIKYTYLSFYEQTRTKDVACYFLTDSERLHAQLTGAGLPCLPWFIPDWTSEHVHILLAAKVAVLCNVFYPIDERGYFPYALLRGAKFIQLWHGIPMKAIGMEAIYSPAAYRPRVAEVLSASGPFDILVGSAEVMRDEWRRRLSFRRYVPLGYPRTDVFFRETSPQDMINVDVDVCELAKAAEREEKPFVLYAPTFRDGAFGVWFEKARMEAISDHCREHGYVLCVNLHPFEGRWVEDFRRRYPHIRFVDPLTDIYPLLKHVSVLITDYSSLAFDFLLCDRPIIFYRPDHEEYVTQSRPLIDGHEQYICGAVASDASGLITAIDAAVEAAKNPANDPYRAPRHALRQRLYDHVDGRAGQRLNALILEELKNADTNSIYLLNESP